MIESVEEAVRADVAGLGELPAGAWGLVASALRLGRSLDNDANSATSASMCAQALVKLMDEIRTLAPRAVEATPLDEIRARRDAKLKAVS